MKNIIGVAILLSITITSFAQNFLGTVLDNETKLPISNVQVYFVDMKTGTTTDKNGVFKIEHFNQKNIHVQILSLVTRSLMKL